MQTKLLGSAGRFRDRLERVTRGLRRWREDRSGAIAIQFAFLVVPITIMAFGLVDLNRMNTQKYNLQDSLDAAALYAARSEADTDAELQVEGAKALNANLSLAPGAELVSSEFKQVVTTNAVMVVADAEIKLPAVVSNLWTNQDLRVKVHTEVNRNSKNVEVALVLDTTGSMGQGTKLADMKAAATELVSIVVKPQQTPFYSKVAIVPYSLAVNAASYADDVRGEIAAGKSIDNMTWWKGSQKNISSISRANPAVVTSNGHGLVTGDVIYMWNVGNPLSSLNNKAYTVTRIDNNSFSIGVSTSNLGSATNGNFRSCLTTNCDVVVTSPSHGFNSGANVHITGVSGGSNLTSAVNAKTHAITRLGNDTFRLNNAQVKISNFSYTGSSNDKAWCTVAGCEFYYFQNAASGEWRTHRISTCVSERTGPQAFTDQGPGSTPLGYNYPATPNVEASSPYVSNGCTTSPIFPLSSVKQDLEDHIDDLVAGGSTGGHLGVAWGWYLVSPNFGNLFPSNSRPAAYSAPNILKVVVLMTDGEYNSAYCNGVISADSTNGSGDSRDHINCNAPNGHAFSQSMALCSAMKAAGIKVYTVGFNIVDDQRARDLVNNCATDDKHVYIANGGTALKDAFASIGREIENLRLSK